MFLVKIGSGSIKEINNVMQSLKLDLWNGVTVETKEEAQAICCCACNIESLIEVDVKEII